MDSAIPALLEIQRAMHRSLFGGADIEAAAHVAGDTPSAAERLAIYRNTCTSVLTNALRLSYPAVHSLVGPDFFAGAACAFIEERPPHSACLDDYGAGFPEFLSRFAPAASLPYLPDVARLEWAVTRALHAPDVEALDTALLLELSEADRAGVRFVPHPSLSLVRAEYPADAIWRGVLERDDAALSAIDLVLGPVWLLVERGPTGVGASRLSEAEWHFAAALCAGRPLDDAVDDTPDIEVHRLLAEHLVAGRFVAFEIADATSTQMLGKPS